MNMHDASAIGDQFRTFQMIERRNRLSTIMLRNKQTDVTENNTPPGGLFSLPDASANSLRVSFASIRRISIHSILL